MLALPCRDGGLGIVNPSSLASQFQDSMHITKSLVQKILQQDQSAEGVPAATITAKAEIVFQFRRLAKEAVASVIAISTSTAERTLNLAAEKGASSWLTCRPLRQYGFNLHKQAFWDALCLRYGWTPPGLPTECVCGKAFSPEHALSCPTGGYPAMRHNDLRDLTASLLREVAHDVQVEPHLQPLTGETFRHHSAIFEDGARLDVAASGVWDVSNGHYWTSGCSTRTPAPTASSPSRPPTGSMRPRKGARTKNASGKLNTRLFLPLCAALPAATASPPPLFSSVSPLCSPTRERSPSPHFLPL